MAFYQWLQVCAKAFGTCICEELWLGHNCMHGESTGQQLKPPRDCLLSCFLFCLTNNFQCILFFPWIGRWQWIWSRRHWYTGRLPHLFSVDIHIMITDKLLFYLHYWLKKCDLLTMLKVANILSCTFHFRIFCRTEGPSVSGSIDNTRHWCRLCYLDMFQCYHRWRTFMQVVRWRRGQWVYVCIW